MASYLADGENGLAGPGLLFSIFPDQYFQRQVNGDAECGEHQYPAFGLPRINSVVECVSMPTLFALFGIDKLWTVLPVTGSWRLGHYTKDDPTVRQKLPFYRYGYDAHTELRPIAP